MKILRTFVVAVFLIFSGLSVNGQCKAFAKKTCLPELEAYTHDGNYHAALLVEGEEAELFKTFYSDMEYRLAVCGEETLSRIEFIVLDANKNVLYTNKDNNYSRTWDFKLQSSQQLRVIIKVNSTAQQGLAPASGCVSIMFGFKIKS